MQWLRRSTCAAGGTVSIPGQEAKSSHARECPAPQKNPFLNVEGPAPWFIMSAAAVICIAMTCGRYHCQGHPASKDGKGHLSQEPLSPAYTSVSICKSGDLKKSPPSPPHSHLLFYFVQKKSTVSHTCNI